MYRTLTLDIATSSYNDGLKLGRLTPELTGRAHTAFNIIGGDNDEKDTIERSV
jgi:hypothetical protein